MGPHSWLPLYEDRESVRAPARRAEHESPARQCREANPQENLTPVPKGRHMAHRYANVIIHSVFSTKHRVSCIPHDLQPKLWKYLGGIGKNHEVPILTAGGTANHAHVLIALPADMSVAHAVQLLKTNSSRWIGEHGIDFHWQEGYGAFSVSTTNVDAVRHYIAHQEL